MSAALVFWQGDAYAWDDGELVAVHNAGDEATAYGSPVRASRPAPVRTRSMAPGGCFPWRAR